MATKLQVLRWQQALADERQAEIMRLIRGADRQMFLALANAEREIGRLLASLPGEGVGALVRRALYSQQRAAIVDTLNRVWGKDIVNATLGGIGTAAEILKGADAALLGVLGKGVPLGAQTLFDSLSGAMGRGIDALRSRYLNDIDLSKSVYNNVAWADGKIGSIIDAGLAAGQSAAEIAQAVRGFINPAVPGGTSFAAMRLGRTEINNAFRSLGQQTYANQPWVEGLVWNLSSSHPEDDDCDALAEADDFDLGPGVYPADQFPFAPHPQCFCYETAITISPDEFVNNLVDGQYDDVPLGFGQPPLTNVFGSLPLRGGSIDDAFQTFEDELAGLDASDFLTLGRGEATDWGGENFTDWSESLDEGQLDAFMQYVQGGKFKEINRLLRAGIDFFDNEDLWGIFQDIKRALNSPLATINEDLTLFRGVPTSFAESWTRGDVFQDPAFCSSSLLESTAQRFGGGWIAEIQAMAGTKGAWLDLVANSAEQELLLQSNTKFMVVDVDRAAKRLILRTVPF